MVLHHPYDSSGEGLASNAGKKSAAARSIISSVLALLIESSLASEFRQECTPGHNPPPKLKRELDDWAEVSLVVANWCCRHGVHACIFQ